MTEQSKAGQNNEQELTAVEEDVETLKQALAEEKAKAAGYLANWQRAEADLANYKRRTVQEKEEISRFGNTTIMLSLLSALDDLERAFNTLPTEPAMLSWVDGIRLIEQKILNALEAQGLSPIEALGEPFDPNFHEAVMQAKGKDGLVVEELQKGYMLHDRVIRPTRVVVGNGEEEETKEA